MRRNLHFQHRADKVEDMLPEVFPVGEIHFVNCYWSDVILYWNNTLFMPDKIEDPNVLSCNHGPHQLSIYNNYTVVRGYGTEDEIEIYEYEFSVTITAAKPELLPVITNEHIITDDDEYKRAMQDSINHLNAASYKLSESQNILMSTDHLLEIAHEHPGKAMTFSFATLVLLALIVICTVKQFRKSEITRLLELSVKRDLVRSMSQDRISNNANPSLQSHPSNISINIRTNGNTESDKPEPKKVNFGRLYPQLRDSLLQLWNATRNPDLEGRAQHFELSPMIRRPQTPHASRTHIDEENLFDVGELEPPTTSEEKSSTYEAIPRRPSIALKDNTNHEERFRQLKRFDSTMSMPGTSKDS
jgi:hypothetical protein